MAHDGEKPALGGVAALRLGTRIDQRLLLGLLHRYVAHHCNDLTAGKAAVRPLRRIERLASYLDPDEAALVVAELCLPDAEFDAGGEPLRRRVRERRQERRAVADVDAVEQPEPVQFARRDAEDGLRVGRGEQHPAVGAVASDDIGHVAGEQAAALLLGGQQPGIGARDPFGAERDAGRIEQGRHDAEPGEGAGVMSGCRHVGGRLHQQQQRRAPERQHGRDRHHAPRRRHNRFQRDQDQPYGGDGIDAAGIRRDGRRDGGQRERGDEMGAFVAAGARQVTGRRDRDDGPHQDDEFEDARDAAHREEHRQGGEREQARNQPRRDEGAVAHRHERVLACRRVHERVQILPDGL